MRQHEGILAALPLALLLHGAIGGALYGEFLLASRQTVTGLPAFRAGDAGLVFTLLAPAHAKVNEPEPAPADAILKPIAAELVPPDPDRKDAADTSPEEPGGDESGASAVGVDGTVPLARDGIRLNYPFGSRERGEEGTVTVRLLVDVEGRARSVRVEVSSGYFALDEAVVKAVQTARFAPAKRNGRPQESETSLTVRFQLRGGDL